MNRSLLEVDDLSIGYRTADGIKLAVDRVSFDLAPGEALGLVGESGCGKTTIGMALMGLLATNATIVSGQARFEGEDLLAAGDRRMRQIRWRRIAMIFQSAMNALNPVHRVNDQIAEAIITHEPRISKQQLAQRIKALFDLVQIPGSRLADYPHQFSGGMRQRVIIAMALACNPSLIIADEPTTALDVIVQDQILRSIIAFQSELTIAMIFISHDIAVVADVCNRIGVMKDGRLVEIGNRQDVLQCPGHPYTRLLLDSLLTLADAPTAFSGDLCVIGPGDPMRDMGCPLSGTCCDATAACRCEPVGWIDLSPTHRVRCINPSKGRCHV